MITLMGREAVLSVLIHPETHKVLMEQRPAGSRHEGKLLFPGGIIEPDESPHDALRREVKEELGIFPTQIVQLSSPLRVDDITLHPFLIQQWEGEIPERILDKGSKLVWKDLNYQPLLPEQRSIFQRVHHQLEGMTIFTQPQLAS